MSHSEVHSESGSIRQYRGRARSDRRSFSSSFSSSTGATLTSELLNDQQNREPYSGATVGAIPSSIVSFHHPHSLQSQSYLGTSYVSDHYARSNRSHGDIEPLVSRPPPALSRTSTRNQNFHFFTNEQITNAEGSSTIEYTDFNTLWDPTPAYEQQRLYGSELASRRSSVFSGAIQSPLLSRVPSYGSGTRYGPTIGRTSSLGVGPQPEVEEQLYRSTSRSSSDSSKYSATDNRIPIEVEERQDELLIDDVTDTSSLSGSSGSNASNDDNSTHSSSSAESSKKNTYQNEFLKPIYHDKFYPAYKPKETVQRFYITEEDLVIGIAGYMYSKFWVFVYNLLCCLTLGMFYLLMRWLPSKRIKFYGKKCPLAKAEWVVIENEFGELVVEHVHREWYNRPLSTILQSVPSDAPSNYDGNDDENYHHHRISDTNPIVPILIFFHYRYIKFIYSPVEDIFKTNHNWTDPDWVDLEYVQRGLSSAVQEDRILAFDKNQINLKIKTTSEILYDEVLHPFYIFQIFSIILWSIDEYYYYAACIFLISVLSIVDTLIETKKTSKNLADMSHFSCDVRVFREGFWTNVNSSDLVPGDVYEVSDPGLKVFPCDSVLLTGDCIVNESMLTGESVPVSKFPATRETMYQLLEDFQHTQMSSFVSKSFMFCGTLIIRTKIPRGHSAVLAMVVRTGFSTTKGSLVRSMVFPKPIGFKFYKDSFKYIAVMTVVALLGFCISCVQFVKLGLDKRTMILRALDIITVVVPPALPATLTIGTSFALNRLKSKGIFCIAPTRVNVGGKVDVMCFDKTGTLTEDGLDVLGVRISTPASHSSFKFGDLKQDIHEVFPKFSLNDCNSPTDVKNRNFLVAMLTCHSLRVVDDELLGDPLDYKMFKFTGWSYDEDFQKQEFHSSYEERHEGSMFPENMDIIPAVVHPNGEDKRSRFVENDPQNFLGIIRSFEFLSELRRMSVIVKPNTGDVYTAYTKGAPEVIAEICNKGTLPTDFEEVLHQYTHSGHRVIACACKTLPKNTWLYSQKVPREEVESNMEFLGFIVFENRLKAATPATLDTLQSAGIRTVMCTGDNVLTAICVGRESGLIQDPLVYIPYLNGPGESHLITWRDVDNPDNILEPDLLTPIGDIESSYTLAVTGEVFRILFSSENRISESYANDILLKSSIYARMSPDEKHELVEQLQRIDYTVGFCGDGANDCGALKAADVGISLSEAEASVAAPFTSSIFDISCVLDVIKEGRAALVTSFACFQYMSLYSAIQFITISILYSRGSNLGDFQFLYIDLLLIIPIAIFMSWSKPYDKLCKKRPSANLVSLKILMPLFTSFMIILLFQMVPWRLVQRMSWYIRPVVGDDDAVESSDNTVLFFFSNFQYILTAVILSIGPPYREPMSKNLGFMLDIFISIIISIWIMFIIPASWLGKLFQLTYISFGFKLFIIVWSAFNYYVQATLPPLTRRYFKKRKSSKKYKNLLRSKKSKVTV